MYAQAEKTNQSKSNAPGNAIALKRSNGKQIIGLADNRSESKAQRKLQAGTNKYTHFGLMQKKENAIFYNFNPIQLLKDSEITSTLSGNGASKATVIDLKKNRPPYADGQVDAVWDAAPKDSEGKATCPNSGKKITWTKGTSRQGVWDMGHKTGHEYKALWEKLATCTINYATFLAEYQNPNNYQVEDCTANRSHQFEDQ